MISLLGSLELQDEGSTGHSSPITVALGTPLLQAAFSQPASSEEGAAASLTEAINVREKNGIQKACSN